MGSHTPNVGLSDLIDALLDAIAERVVTKLRETATAATPDPEWITVHATAKRYGVSVRALHDAARRGEIQSTRAGRRVLLRRESLLAWFESHAREKPEPMAAPVTSLREALARRGAR